MELNLTLDAPFMCEGENGSRVLQVCTGGLPLDDKSVHIAFVTPGGKSYLTDELTPEELKSGYAVPFTVLDRYGRLCAQLIVTDSGGYCKKSDICFFDVRPEITENGGEPDDGEFLSMAQIDGRLKILEELILGLVPIPESELASILV